MRTLIGKTRLLLGAAAIGLAVGLTVPVVHAAEPLKGFAKGYAKFADEELTQAEKNLAGGLPSNAKSKLDKAKYQFNKIKSSNPNLMSHPTVVDLQKRIEAVEAGLNGKKPAAPAPKAQQAEAAPSGVAPLKGFPKGYAKFAEEAVSKAEKDFANGLPSNAGTSVEQAKYQLGKIKNSDPALMQHPRVVAIQQRVTEVEGKITAHFAAQKSSSGSSAATKAPSAPASTSAAPAAPAQPATPTVSSAQPKAEEPKAVAAAAPAANSDDQWKEIMVIMDNAKSAIVKKAYFPDTDKIEEMSEAFTNFDFSIQNGQTALQGYDDAVASGKLSTKGNWPRRAEALANELGNTLKRYGGRKDDYVKKVFAEAKKAVADSNEAMVKADSAKGPQKTYWSSQAGDWLANGTKRFDIALNALGEATTDGVRAQADEIKAGRKGVEDKIAKINADVKAAEEARIASNRFPSGYNASVDPKVIAAAEKEFGTKVLRSAEIEGWTLRREAKWVNTGWVFNNYKYYKLWLAKKASTGNILAYSMRFRQKEMADGSWSAVHYYSVGSTIRILEENLDK